MGGECGTCGADVRCIQSFGVKPEGKRENGKPKSRQKTNTEINPREIGYEGVDCIDPAER